MCIHQTRLKNSQVTLKSVRICAVQEDSWITSHENCVRLEVGCVSPVEWSNVTKVHLQSNKAVTLKTISSIVRLSARNLQSAKVANGNERQDDKVTSADLACRAMLQTSSTALLLGAILKKKTDHVRSWTHSVLKKGGHEMSSSLVSMDDD